METNWISVKDRLPNKSQEVMWYMITEHGKSKRIIIDYIYGKQEPIEYGISAYCLWDSEAIVITEEQNKELNCWCYTTHWMPLPEMPK